MMTTILVSLIVASCLAVAFSGTQTHLFGEQTESLEAIAIPVRDVPARQVISSTAFSRR